MTTAMPSIEGEALQRVEIGNGLEFHYVEAGSGLPLVLACCC